MVYNEVRMKNGLICFFLLSFLIINIHAEKIGEFGDSFKNPFVILDESNIYVWDQYLSKVYIYSRKDFKKLAEFGRKGLGPGEFNNISKVYLDRNYIYVNTFPKLCLFYKNGRLKKEIKSNTNAGGFIPFGSNFVGVSYPYTNIKAKKDIMLYSLFDSKLNKKKDIYQAEFNKIIRYGYPKEIVFFFRGCTKGIVYEDKLFIGSSDKGIYIAVFDLSGNRLYEINWEYEKRKVTESEKVQKLEGLKKVISKSEWEKRKMICDYRFPEYYPAFESFAIDREKIYLFKFPKDNKLEIVILNLKGDLVRKKIIPDNTMPGCIWFNRFDLKDDCFFYLKENDDTGNWELHAEKLD